MRLLLVEDDETLIYDLESAIEELVPGTDVVVSRSRDSAYEELARQWFDLIVSDLKLPTVDHGLDREVEHGLAVHARATQTSPGTPIIILSAFLSIEIMQQMQGEARKEDVFGSGEEHPLLLSVQKKALPDCLDHVQDVAREVSCLADIEIVGSVDLVDSEARVLQVFARWVNGVQVEVTPVGGGLSDARTVRLLVQDAEGAVRARAFGKIADVDQVLEERDKGRRLVAPVLDVGNCVADVGVVSAGAGHSGGVFYPYADTYERSLFDVLRDSAPLAADVVRRLQVVEARWQDAAPQNQMEVANIRRRIVSDDILSAIGKTLKDTVDWESFEQRRVPVRTCCQHGDLHGGNILVNADGLPLLIDYGEVGDATAVLDPTTLELSVLFHPDAIAIRGNWPSMEQAESWCDLDAYVEHSPVAEFVTACRDWARACGRGHREMLATAYAVAVRQLKYESTDHALAGAIAQSVIRGFD